MREIIAICVMVVIALLGMVRIAETEEMPSSREERMLEIVKELEDRLIVQVSSSTEGSDLVAVVNIFILPEDVTIAKETLKAISSLVGISVERPFVYECYNSQCRNRQRETAYRESVGCFVCAANNREYGMRYLGEGD